MTFSGRLLWSLGIAAAVMLTGCATQREVAGNRFVSEFPKMEIEVSKEFKYVGMQEIGGASQSRFGGPPATGRRSDEFYNWNEVKRKEGAPYRAFYIKIATLVSPNWNWHTPAIDRNGKYILDYDMLTVGDIQYEKAVRVARVKGRAKCVLMESVTNTSYKKTFVEIAYWESVKDTPYTCAQWKDKGNYTDAQKQYVAGFRKRADLAFSPKPAFLSYSVNSVKEEAGPEKREALPLADEDEPPED